MAVRFPLSDLLIPLDKLRPSCVSTRKSAFIKMVHNSLAKRKNQDRQRRDPTRPLPPGENVQLPRI